MLGEAAIELLGRQPFPLADVDLAQLGHGPWLQPGPLADNRGCLGGAQDVAGVERRGLVANQALADSAGLLAALLVQRNVGVALIFQGGVPIGLAVSDE